MIASSYRWGYHDILNMKTRIRNIYIEFINKQREEEQKQIESAKTGG